MKADEVRELEDALMHYVKTVCYEPQKMPPEAFTVLSAVSKVLIELNTEQRPIRRI